MSTKQPIKEAKASKKDLKVKVIKLDTPQAKVEKATVIKKKLVKEVTPRNQANLVESVISNRQVKYIYPADVNDTLSRKSWRQKVRNKLEALKMKMLEIADKNSKEFKSAKKAYESYEKQVIKVS